MKIKYQKDDQMDIFFHTQKYYFCTKLNRNVVGKGLDHSHYNLTAPNGAWKKKKVKKKKIYFTYGPQRSQGKK